MRYTVDLETTMQANGDAVIKATARSLGGKPFRVTYRLTHSEMRVSSDAKRLVAHHEQRVMSAAISKAHVA